MQRFVLGRATIDATGCVRELKKKGATIQLYWTPSVWGAGGSAGGKHLQEQPMNESCQKSIWDNIFIANLDHLSSNSTVFRGKVHSQVACHKGSLAHDFLASRFP